MPQHRTALLVDRMVHATSGNVPLTIHWQHFTFPFENFATDGRNIRAIFFGASSGKGSFAIQIDDISLQ